MIGVSNAVARLYMEVLRATWPDAPKEDCAGVR
jgi:hypothetical protein